jgi:uncharacterized protein YbjT (DUF2867 family)
MPTGADIDLLSVGGTGLAGRAVVAEAVGRGLRVRVLSRHVPDAGSPVRVAGAEYVAGDILTGAGVQAALAGVRALVDTTNGTTRATRPTLTVGARVLTDAAALAGVRRLVLLSIVNVDRSDFAYYQAKAEQERIYLGAQVDARLVRATQFHDLVATFCHLVPFGLATALDGIRFQPIAVADVARALVDQATPGESTTERTVIVGGPLIQTTRELAELWQRAHGRHGHILTVPLPGRLGDFFRSGQNLAPDRRGGTVTFEEWLASSDGGQP